MSNASRKKTFRTVIGQFVSGALRSLFLPPSESCCGKPVVFLDNKKSFRCSRCNKRWSLVVKVQGNPRTDWDQMAIEMNALVARLQKKPKEARRGFQLSPGGILNAYREGDVSFKKAVALLKRLAKQK